MSNVSNLFNSVAETDFFHLLQNGTPDGKKVAELLKYKKEDISEAADVSIDSIRFDKRMPEKLKERFIEWANALNLVGSFFNDPDKTVLWFQISNPALGGMKPKDMIRYGRYAKLLRYIQTALDENKR